MKKKRILRLAKELDDDGSVEFDYGDYIYNIFLRSDGDYQIDISEPVDGGVCTGSPTDAIEFMLDIQNEKQ